MQFINHLLEPQNVNIGSEIWVLILLIVTLTTYGLKVVTDISAVVLGGLLLLGAYLGNVAARALELVPASTNITADIVLGSTYASFAGMISTMLLWFIWRLALPTVIEPSTLKRPNQPRAVVGNTD